MIRPRRYDAAPRSDRSFSGSLTPVVCVSECRARGVLVTAFFVVVLNDSRCHLPAQQTGRNAGDLRALLRFNPKFRPISQSFSRIEIDIRMSPSIRLHAERRKTAVNTAVWDGKAFAEDDEDEIYAAPNEVLKVIVDPGSRRSTNY